MTLRQTGPRHRGGGASAAVVDHHSHSGKQLGVIAVTNCDYSLGQRAMGEAPDTVQYHAATPSDPERLDNEARGGAGIDFASRAEPDVDGRVAAVKEDLELAWQRTFVGRCQIADLHRRRRRVRCYWPQRLVACQQWPFSQHMRIDIGKRNHPERGAVRVHLFAARLVVAPPDRRHASGMHHRGKERAGNNIGVTCGDFTSAVQ